MKPSQPKHQISYAQGMRKGFPTRSWGLLLLVLQLFSDTSIHQIQVRARLGTSLMLTTERDRTLAGLAPSVFLVCKPH